MTDPNALSLNDLYTALTADGLTARLFRLARAEDLGPNNTDATTSAMRIGEQSIHTAIVARATGITAGLNALDDLLQVFAPNASCTLRTNDGATFQSGDTLATLDGPANEVLALERTLLNLLSRLSGIATLTNQYVDAVKHTEARILDTRKTTPGWRALEKYAVRCGGGHCHRMGLHDAVLIKDNHLALANKQSDDLSRTLRDAANRAHAAGDPSFVEVEVDTLDQLKQVLSIDPGLIDIVLLDNMPLNMLTEAVAMRDASAPSLLLEASGGITLDSIASIASTGIDRISIGALTHQAVSIDIALDTI